MNCGRRGCECNTCQDCGKLHNQCICELVEKTRTFLNRSDFEYEDDFHRATGLLEEWLDAK